MKLTRNLQYIVLTLPLLSLGACYPDTLRQELAGTDTIEVIFKASEPKASDTLKIKIKRYIQALLNDFSEEKISPPAQAEYSAKIFFKKMKIRGPGKRLLLKGDLCLSPENPHLRYRQKDKMYFRSLNADGLETLNLIRRYPALLD